MVSGAVLGGREVEVELPEGICSLHQLLPIQKVEREVIYRVVECDALPTARCIKVVDGCCTRKLRREFEVGEGIDNKGYATEGVGSPARETVDKGLCAVAAEVDLVGGLLGDAHTKVEEKLPLSGEVGMCVEDVRDAVQADLLGCYGHGPDGAI